jgi:Domain of unknown function (DUF222)
VLDALGTSTGPEDTRSQRQRDHDALAEAMRRLTAANCLPQRAGQPTQIQVHMTLEQLLGLPGAIDKLAIFILGRHGIPAHPATADLGQAAPGQAAPAAFTGATAIAGGGPGAPAAASADAWLNAPGWLTQAAARATSNRMASQSRASTPGTPDDTRRHLAYHTVRQTIVKAAAEVLSGPQGLAAFLRTGLLGGPAASVSLPLDAGATVEIVPAYLRRLLVKRDKHCRFPGCHVRGGAQDRWSAARPDAAGPRAGRCGDWLTPPPSPSGPQLPGRHDERGMGTFNWPQTRLRPGHTRGLSHGHGHSAAIRKRCRYVPVY